MPSIRLALLAAVAGCGFWASGALAACYVVYGADQQVVYRGQTPPVDMSRNLHETLPAIAPGGRMVFSLDSDGCEPEIHRLQPARGEPRVRRPARPARR